MSEAETIERRRYDDPGRADYVLGMNRFLRWALIVFWPLPLLIALFLIRGETGDGWWFYAAVVLLALVFIAAAVNKANRRGWSLLIADKARLYITDSPKADLFIAVPWARVKRCEAATIGLNYRGIRFTINAAGLSPEEVDILLGAAWAWREDRDIVIGVSTGMHRRDKAIAELRRINPALKP